ncbi:SWIM zinc finger domain-containing protein [Halorubrum rubrum]|uniref:SWIM zinc finger domain-containing protein n=1 Tax=Halorubrum rubrum TaxID=1126240 RepID=A0ABD5QZU8_9EURY|nr:SWIM zinc finger family protein [Halorubrum rubrum]
MDLTTEDVRERCTDAVFERGREYLDGGRIARQSRFDDEIRAAVRGSRLYEVHVDRSAPDLETRCDCPYDGPGACKHVVAVLLCSIEDPPPDESDRIDDLLEDATADELRAFLREECSSDTDLRDRLLARFGASTTRSVEGIRAEIDGLFGETNPEYAVVFEPIDFREYFDLAATYRDRGQYESAATIYRGLVEALDDDMELVDGAYDHFSGAFADALDGYVDCASAAKLDSNEVDRRVGFLAERAVSGTPFLRDHFERAAAELRERTR